MPLIPRPTLGIGVGQRTTRNVILTAGISLFVMMGVAVVGLRIGRQVLASGSPVAAGVLMVGLGFAVAIIYGIARDTTTGLMVWMGAMVFGRLVGGGGLLTLDRVAFLALVGAFFIEVVTGRRELGRFGTTEFLMLCFVIYLFGSIVAPHALPAVGEKGEDRSLIDLILTSAFLPFAGFVLARQLLVTERNVRRFLWFIVGFGVYLALTNVFWLIGPESLVFPPDILDGSVGTHDDRGRGVFLNAAVTGYVLVVTFVVAMYLASRSPRRWVRYPLLASGLLMLIGIGLTQTRSAWLAAVVVVLFGAAMHSGFRRWYVFILIGFVALVAVNWQTVTSQDRTQGGVTSTNETDDRLNAAATGIWAIKEKPVLGWGLGRFPAINTIHHQAWGDTPWKRGYGIYPHDTQIGIGAELGLAGLTLWLLIIVSMVVASRRAYRTLPRSGLVSRELAVVFWCTGIAWIVTASLIDVRLFSFANTLFFIFGGMCAGLADAALAERGEDEDDEPAPGLIESTLANPVPRLRG
jgi:O-antigen ligase